jgi:hypothetical protein
MRAHTNLMLGILAIVTVVAVVTPGGAPFTLTVYSLPVIGVYLAGAFTPRRRAS